MGIGDAYLGLVDLLSNHGKSLEAFQGTNLTEHTENTTEIDGVVECLIAFVAETTIQSIKRATDDSIAEWYHAVSIAGL
jgi:histone deacetylase 6